MCICRKITQKKITQNPILFGVLLSKLITPLLSHTSSDTLDLYHAIIRVCKSQGYHMGTQILLTPRYTEYLWYWMVILGLEEILFFIYISAYMKVAATKLDTWKKKIYVLSKACNIFSVLIQYKWSQEPNWCVLPLRDGVMTWVSPTLGMPTFSCLGPALLDAYHHFVSSWDIQTFTSGCLPRSQAQASWLLPLAGGGVMASLAVTDRCGCVDKRKMLLNTATRERKE